MYHNQNQMNRNDSQGQMQNNNIQYSYQNGNGNQVMRNESQVNIQPNNTQNDQLKSDQNKVKEESSSTEEGEDNLKKIVMGSSVNLLNRLSNLNELPAQNELNSLLGDFSSETSDESSESEVKENILKTKKSIGKAYPYFLPSESSEELDREGFGTLNRKLTLNMKNDGVDKDGDSEEKSDDLLSGSHYDEPIEDWE